MQWIFFHVVIPFGRSFHSLSPCGHLSTREKLFNTILFLDGMAARGKVSGAECQVLGVSVGCRVSDGTRRATRPTMRIARSGGKIQRGDLELTIARR